MTRKGLAAIRSVAASVAIASLPGCVSLEREYPEKRFYALEASRARTAPSGDGRLGVLEVRDFRTAPLDGGDEFVYRRGGARYETDFYHRFFTAPGTLVADQTRRWLARSGLFRHVSQSSSRADPTLFLEAAVTSLHGDFSSAEEPRAVLEIQFLLLEENASGNEILLTADYLERVTLPRAGPAELVDGWNEALSRVLAAFEEDLSKLGKGEAPGG